MLSEFFLLPDNGNYCRLGIFQMGCQGTGHGISSPWPCPLTATVRRWHKTVDEIPVKAET
jgi:hypothetical protein